MKTLFVLILTIMAFNTAYADSEVEYGEHMKGKCIYSPDKSRSTTSKEVVLDNSVAQELKSTVKKK